MNQTRQRIGISGFLALLLVSYTLTGALVTPASAVTTMDLLKVGGVLLAVNQFGDEVNHFVNNVLSQRRAELAGATKVVPIFSVGQGAYIGAAQVVGVPDAVKKVECVVAAEGVYARLQGSLMVPISTKVPGASLSTVKGVGVSAITDLKL